MTPTPPAHTPTTAALAIATLAAALLAGCGSAPSAPPPALVHLDTAAVPALPAAVTPAAEHWQLVLPVRLPAALEREAVMVGGADGELRPWQGRRWSEPLRDALPRLLVQDLSALRGADRVWPGSPPPGVRVDRQLRVQVLSWDARDGAGEVRMTARWSLADPSGAAAPQVWQRELSRPWRPASAAALAQAQRELVRELALAIARPPA